MLRQSLFCSLLAAVALAACAPSPSLRAEAAAPGSGTPDMRKMPVKEWPMRFWKHTFRASCYDTLECEVWYAGFRHGSDKPAPPSSTYGPGYMDHLVGGHGMIPNFPAPAEVSWRSRDGERLRATIDTAEIFEDEIIRHNVAREEMADVPDGEFKNEPSILLEINDRTIRVYMRVHMPTKRLQKPGNRYSNFRNDLILVRTYNY